MLCKPAFEYTKSFRKKRNKIETITASYGKLFTTNHQLDPVSQAQPFNSPKNNPDITPQSPVHIGVLFIRPTLFNPQRVNSGALTRA